MGLFDRISRIGRGARVAIFGEYNETRTARADGDQIAVQTDELGNVRVVVENPEDIGGGSGGGEVTQGAGSGAATVFWTVRLSNGTSYLSPLVAGENVLADLRVGGSAVSSSNRVPVEVVGPTAAGSIALTNPVRAGGVDSNGATRALLTDVGGRLLVDLPTKTGQQSVALSLSVAQASSHAFNVAGAAPIADATTGVYSRFPTNGLTAFSSGSLALRTSAGRFRTIEVYYEGATVSGLWLQVHNAASVGAISTSTLLLSRPINSGSNQLLIERLHDVPFSAGLTLAFVTNRFDPGASQANVATGETGRAVFWGA